jgi:hypothetical protein
VYRAPEDFLFDILPAKRLLSNEEYVDANMKIMRIIAVALLAFLYLGGACAQVYGAAFPLVGTGKKAYGDFKGKGREPSRPAISPRRHMPMVKPVVMSPLIPADQPESGRTEDLQIVVEPSVCPSLLSSPVLSCGTRAPPAL